MQLKILQALDRRGDLTHQEQYELLNRLNGRQAEDELCQLLRTDKPNPNILSNNLLDVGNKTEYDLLVLSPDCLIHLEVKHYQGHLTCYNGEATLNQREIDNPFFQVKNAHRRLRRYLKKTHVSVTVESYLVFTHEFMTLDTDEDPATYYTRKRLPQLIAKVNRLPVGDIPYLPALEKTRTRYEVGWLNRKKFSRTGVPCFQCGSYATVFNRRNVICNICQTSLIKSDYLSVAIDDYAVVHWDQPLDSVQINHLLEGNFSIPTIIHNLSTH